MNEDVFPNRKGDFPASHVIVFWGVILGTYPEMFVVGFLRVPGVFLGNPKDSVWEDWGTLGKIRGITTPP